MIFEKSIEELLEFDYDRLKSYLLQVKEETCKKVLANEKIKHKLIDDLKRHNFIWLAQENNNYIIPSLLDGQGLIILANTSEVVDKLNGIITSGQDYVAELFKNRDFITLVLKYHQSLNYIYSQITSEGAYNFIKELVNMKIDSLLLTKIISLVNKDAQLKVVANLDLPDEILTPELLINNSDNYNEILIRQASLARPDEMDLRIPIPKMVSLYCYDEITENDIESAKNLGVGIMLVLTRKYHKKEVGGKVNLFDTMTFGDIDNMLNNNYLTNMNQDAMHGRR